MNMEEQSTKSDALVLLSDPKSSATLSASSVLQKNTKLYGPMNALDVENGSSSWNSEGNTKIETSLVLQFGRPVRPITLKLQFQAGFSAESCSVSYFKSSSGSGSNTNLQTGDSSGAPTDDSGMPMDEFELSDVHELQTFELSSQVTHAPITKLKLVLDDFCDFYGRVILYRLEVWGHEV